MDLPGPLEVIKQVSNLVAMYILNKYISLYFKSHTTKNHPPPLNHLGGGDMPHATPLLTTPGKCM